MNKGAIAGVVLLGGLAYFLSRKDAPSSGSSTTSGADVSNSSIDNPLIAATDTSVGSSPIAAFARSGDSVVNVGGAEILLNAKGYIRGDTLFKGKISKSADAQLYNLQKRYGENVKLYSDPSGDPTTVLVDKSIQITGPLPAGIRVNELNTNQVTRSTRRPATQDEANAKRAANLTSLISSGQKSVDTLSKSSKKLLGG